MKQLATAVNTGEYFIWTCECGYEEEAKEVR
jgi:hypothetical protein